MDWKMDVDQENLSASTSHNIDDLILKTDYTGHTLLHWAVQHNKPDLCLELVSRGCDVDHTDNSGTSPLMLACYHGLSDIAQILLASGACFHLTNDYGVDALGMACANDHLDIVKLLNDYAARCCDAAENSEDSKSQLFVDSCDAKETSEGSKSQPLDDSCEAKVDREDSKSWPLADSCDAKETSEGNKSQPLADSCNSEGSKPQPLADSCNSKGNKSWPQHSIILSAACGSRQCLTYFYHLDKQSIHITNNISGMNALMLAEAGNFTEMKSDLLEWGAERNHRVKPFVPKLCLPTLITPFVDISPLLSPSPLPLSPCCSRQQPVFLFPSQTLGSPCLSNCGSPYLPNPGSPYVSNFGLLNHGSPCLPNHDSQCLLKPNRCPPFQTNVSHPLTPNLCFSPKKTKNASQKKSKPLSWLKKLKRKRSRSVENLTEVKRKWSSDIEQDNILDYILSTANLSEYRSAFTNQEVTFRTFLTLNEEDLVEVGIKKSKVRRKMLALIQHYRRIFNSQ